MKHGSNSASLLPQTSVEWPTAILFCVCFLFLASGRGVHAQTGALAPQSAGQQTNAPSASIAGTVTDESGKPLRGAIVRLEQDGWELAHTTTSPAGEYRFAVQPIQKPYAVSAKLPINATLQPAA